MRPPVLLSLVLSPSPVSLAVEPLVSHMMLATTTVCGPQSADLAISFAYTESGASRLEGNTSQNPLTGNTSQSATSYSSGTGLGTNTTSSKTSSEPMSEKVRETFGIGGSNKHGTGLGGREEGPGYGTASKNDKDSSRLGSVVGHGSNPDKYLYNSKNAPGIGGHRLEGSDDFTQSNIRHEGADKLPSTLGSDVAAGNAKHSSTSQSSSGGLASGLSSAASRLTGTGNDRDVSSTTGHHHGEHDRNTSGINPTSGTGATSALARKAEEYLPGTTGHSTTSHTAPTGTETGRGPIDSGLSGNQNNTALAGATAAIAGSGRHEPGYGNSTYDQSALPIRTHDSMSGGEHQGRGLVGTALSGAGIGGTGSGLTGSHGHHHGISDPLCDEGKLVLYSGLPIK